MNCALAVLVFWISLDFRRGEGLPTECYTCQSTTDSPVCGEGFSKGNFLTKHCLVTQHYCIKIIETAGRTPIIYRKCSHNNCEQEIEIRHGAVSECSDCSTTKCNVGSIISPSILPLIYSLTITTCFHQVLAVGIFDTS